MERQFVKDWAPWVAAARYDARKLAQLRCVSLRQLQRDFKRTLGRSPQDWLNEQRIVTARQLLQAGFTIKQVSIDLGYKQSSHFCRQFKTFSRMTPSQYASRPFEPFVANR